MRDEEYIQLLEKLTEAERAVLWRVMNRQFRSGVDAVYHSLIYEMYIYARRMGLREAFHLMWNQADLVRDWSQQPGEGLAGLPLLEVDDDEAIDRCIERWRNARRQAAERKWYASEAKRLLQLYRHAGRERDLSGFVYFIRAGGSSGLVKIGRARNVQRRLMQISHGQPFPLKVVGVIPTRDCYLLESVLHHYFAGERLGGEWFNLTSDEIDFIQWINWADICGQRLQPDPVLSSEESVE